MIVFWDKLFLVNWRSDPLTSNVTIFGNRSFKDTIRLYEILRVGLIQYDLCPYKKREWHQECSCTEKMICEDMTKGGQLQAVAGDRFPEEEIGWHLNLGLPIWTSVRNNFLLFKLRSLVCIFMIALTNYYRW